MIRKRLITNRHGDPELILRVVGTHDIDRLAGVFARGQVEFCALARRIRRSLATRKRRLLAGDDLPHPNVERLEG